MPAPLFAPTFSTYSKDDVLWLLSDISDVELEAPKEEREEAIQSGAAHYSESLPVEYQPPAQYMDVFYEALRTQGQTVADAIGAMSEQIVAARGKDVVLVSLARAGVPVGILAKRWIDYFYGTDVAHYAVSIVRGRGIDAEALNYIAASHNPKNVVFVDGWTGKGAITRELALALEEYEEAGGAHFSEELAVLADTGCCANFYGVRGDMLIPSSCLNSTVSGLISRTVLNYDFIKPGMFHGGKFYKHLMDSDVSNMLLDTITALFDRQRAMLVFDEVTKQAQYGEVIWTGWDVVERIADEYGIPSVNLVKPGIGETTRVLLRRIPWLLLVRASAPMEPLKHVLLLAHERGVPVEYRDDIGPYDCIGIINPKYDKSATGEDGKAL